MATTNPVKNEINNLKAEYDRLAKGKESFLTLLMSPNFLKAFSIQTLLRIQHLRLEKRIYYASFREYRDSKNAKTMEKIVTLVLMESLHKRIAYLRGEMITSLTDFVKTRKKSINTLLNAARRQTIPAFRGKGVWKIGDYSP